MMSNNALQQTFSLPDYSTDNASDMTVRRILSFMRLPVGWHYGEGVPADLGTATAAISVVEFLNHAGAEVTEAFPIEDGGILVSGYHGDETVDITCHSNSGYSLLQEIDDEEVEDREDLNSADIEDYIEGLTWQSQKSSEHFILNISVGNLDVSKASPVKTPVVMDVYRSLMPNVPAKPVVQYANISENSTIASPVIHQFSGVSPWAISQAGEN